MSASYCVVIPAHNSERYLGTALDSVARQAVAPVQTVVVDDGSSDRTQAIARAAGATVVVAPASQGPSAARNRGVAHSSAPLIAFLDADDEWLPDHASRLLQLFDDADVVFAGSSAEKFGSEVGIVGPAAESDTSTDLRDLLITENPVIQSAEVGRFNAVGAATVRRRMHAEQVSQRYRGDLVRAWWHVRRRTVGRRLSVASQFERVRVLQILEQSARLDVDWAIWTGDGAMLTIVREELRATDEQLGLGTRLSAAGGLGQPALRLSQDVRCGSRSLLQFFQGQR
jgi:glycosyltransferase involved in cell wall biosynthesis